jgi:putative two-component system response regulator
MAIEEKNQTILVVDDEEVVRRPLQRKLTREGYDCIEADSAPGALSRLKAAPVELAILDIMMPGKTGLELLTEMRDEHPDTAVIMATAIAEPGIIIECMKNGAQDYITKPFNLNQVVHSVDSVLRKRHLELMMKDYQASLRGKVDEQAKQIRDLFLGAVESLVTALEAKDTYTAGHSRRVKDLSILLSQRLGMTEKETEDLRWGALLHDVGKIAIDPAIQNKPGKLTKEEYDELMRHTQVGPRIVKPVTNENIMNIIRYHHTRYDGHLSGQVQIGHAIPVYVRIVTLADSFDAMISDRPYRRGRSIQEAMNEIKRCSGSQFDPELVDTLVKIPVSEIESAIKDDLMPMS